MNSFLFYILLAGIEERGLNGGLGEDGGDAGMQRDEGK